MRVANVAARLWTSPERYASQSYKMAAGRVESRIWSGRASSFADPAGLANWLQVGSTGGYRNVSDTWCNGGVFDRDATCSMTGELVQELRHADMPRLECESMDQRLGEPRRAARCPLYREQYRGNFLSREGDTSHPNQARLFGWNGSHTRCLVEQLERTLLPAMGAYSAELFGRGMFDRENPTLARPEYLYAGRGPVVDYVATISGDAGVYVRGKVSSA